MLTCKRPVYLLHLHPNRKLSIEEMAHAYLPQVLALWPVGPLRLDLGYSINPPYFFGFKGTQQELVNAGVNPCSPPPGVPNQCVVQNISHFQFFFSIGQTF